MAGRSAVLFGWCSCVTVHELHGWIVQAKRDRQSSVYSSSDNLSVLKISFMLWEVQCVVQCGHAYRFAYLA